MAVSTLASLITAINGQSTATVTYTVAALSSGWWSVYRNGVQTWQFNFSPVPGGAAWSSGANDANLSGALIDLLSPDGVKSKADVQQWINSLK
jgi:hypothetical protein